jgi:RNA polymerase sigma factor (sigma-70 family)
MMRPHQQKQKDEGVNFPYGDDSLTAELYQQYASKIFSYLCQHLSSLDAAEDLLLEVFLTTLEHEQDLESRLEDEQRAWLWTVARNKIFDHYRHTRRHQTIPLEQIAEMIENDGTPEQIALRNEEHDCLRSNLKKLSALQQEVLQLRFTSGLPCAEIAEILNKREGAIRTMLSRTLNTLRNIYRQQI